LTTSPFSEEKKDNDRLKMNEQYGNVIENKGLVFHRPQQNGNVIENKDSYALNAGMLLKTKGVDGMS
jgi:hypothetical protein